VSDFEELVDSLEELLERMEALEEPLRTEVFALLDGVDAVHRSALGHLAAELDPETLERLRGAHPSIAWLLDAYGVGVDEMGAADAALEAVRPYIHSHGGSLELLSAREGVVRVRMAGSCSGCTASQVTLTHGVEEALRDGMPGFRTLEVEQDEAPAHPPPGPTLLQIEGLPS
jgi:Fe-S cluster biogenesis protein NfuA